MDIRVHSLHKKPRLPCLKQNFPRKAALFQTYHRQHLFHPEERNLRRQIAFLRAILPFCRLRERSGLPSGKEGKFPATGVDSYVHDRRGKRRLTKHHGKPERS
jgi:hypothetical protein